MDFDNDYQPLIDAATQEAQALSAPSIEAEHLVLAALATGLPARSAGVLATAGLKAATVRSWLAATTDAPPQPLDDSLVEVGGTITKALDTFTDVAERLGATHFPTDLVMHSIFACAKRRSTLWRLCEELATSTTDLAARLAVPLRGRASAATRPSTPFDQDSTASFGVELVAVARDGGFDPHVGRDKEISELLATLLRRGKHNAVLVGEPGVGKTAIVEALAQRIATGDVPAELVDAKILSLDTAALLAGTKARGDFEQKLRALLKVLEEDKNTILFIDEVHQILGAGSNEGGLDMANLLKPALARSDLRVIGATTWDEYRNIFSKDEALDRRFRPVAVEPPDIATATAIVTRVAANFAVHHGVMYTADALNIIAPLAQRYVKDRFLPDSAIDVLDEVAAAVAMQRRHLSAEVAALAGQLAAARRDTHCEEVEVSAVAACDVERLACELEALNAPQSAFGVVGTEQVRSCVADMVGVGVEVVDVNAAARLGDLRELLAAQVFGQDAAVDAASRAVRRRRAGLGDSKRPASMLFCGPSGVGKTETARALARSVYGDESALVQIDMSEYMEQQSVSRLVGAPPGYVGHDEPGALSEPVRRKRACVVLLDEIDKAHPAVSDILLQILEEGRLTDSSGTVVDFSETVVIATCNVAAATRRRDVGFSQSSGSMSESEVAEALKSQFRPELLNRFDDVIRFNELSTEALEAIVADELATLEMRAAERGLGVVVDASARALLAQLGADPDMGARPVRRAVQSKVTDALIMYLLDPSAAEGSVVHVSAAGNEIVTALVASPAPALVEV